MTLDLDAIEARANAAHPGPWQWSGNARFHSLELSYWEPGFGRCVVLRPVRAGMNSATVGFDVDGLVKRAEEMSVYEVAPDATRADDPRVYRHDIIGIRHPDAAFIAAARQDVPALAAEVRRLRSVLAEVRSLVMNTDGEWLDTSDFDGLAGEIQAALHNPEHEEIH